MNKNNKILPLVLFLALSISGFAQYQWDFGITAGASNYLGDIGGKEKTRRDFVADMKLAKTRWNGGLFARYRWYDDVYFRLNANYIRVEGDDKLSSNPGRRFRNLSFRNDIFEGNVCAEWHFFEDKELTVATKNSWAFNSYAFFGAGVFYHNPKTFYKGKWVNLRPLRTEGVKYKKFVMDIPLGVGLFFTYNRRHRFGFDMCWRKTFTDYIDDISGNYPDAPPENPLAASLSKRTDELPKDVIDANIGAYLSHIWGNKRGDKSRKDNFMTMSVYYSYAIRGSSGFYKNQGGLFSSKKKRSIRKIRARF
ncbi:MAG: DUF6089 family protein [Sediminibacterium sp.]|nr:DUF6089 family protein [Sediminibacterium sp.]